MEPLLRMDPSRCTGCEACATVCPHRIPRRGPGGLPGNALESEGLCIRCGHCVAACPADALAHRDLPAAGFPLAAPAPPSTEVLAWLRGRRSVRTYQPRFVDRETAGRLLEAARYAPTGHNAREVGCVAVCSTARRSALGDAVVAFYRRVFRLAGHRAGRLLLAAAVGRRRVGELGEALPGLARAEARLARGEDPLFHRAPAILLFHAPPAETAETDCALAAAQVTLFAPSVGLGTCYIGYAAAALRRSPRMAQRFGVPRGQRVYTVLTVGYPAVAYRRSVPRPAVRVRYL